MTDIDADIQVPSKLLPLFTTESDFIGIYGGRMSGKSEAVARVAILKMIADRRRGVKYGFFREVQKSLNDSVKSLLERVIHEAGLAEFFHITDKTLKCTLNDIDCVFSGLLAHTVDTMKSLDKLVFAWVEEAQSISQRSIDVLEPTVIRNRDFKIIYTWNPDNENTPIHKHMLVSPPPNSKTININYLDNKFLNDTALAIIDNLKRTNFAAYRHIYLGEFITENENAIWSKNLIDQHRIQEIGELKTVVIGVDPAGGDIKKAKKGGNDEYGIVACGILKDSGHGVVLEDASGTYKPEAASKAIARLYHKWHAGYVVAESNYGGQMVSDIVKLADKNLRVKLVTAVNSKRYRANPVHNRYERGDIKHFGIHSVLEYQMCNWTEDEKYSPDRMDAMVHAFRDLFKLASTGTKVYAA